LYRVFTPSNVLNSDSLLPQLGNSTEVTFDVASNSATLISPDEQDLASVMPLPPSANESMVFITDTSNTKQCSTCVEQPVLAVDALQQAVIQLYGPQSGNQTNNFRLASYSLPNLQSLLDDQEVPFIKDDLTRANWIIISLTDTTLGQTGLISRFLRERSDLLRGKRVILFAFGAPYYFDTTTISKFTAYYALYSKQPQFVDVAARLLFQELTPVGESPVSVPAVGYDLNSVMSPDPDQVIPLFLDLEPVPVSTDQEITPEATPIPLFRIGDTIAIRTGVIIDNNGNPVPDGTAVIFSMMLTGEGGGILKQYDAVTTQGVARAVFGLDKPGLLEISVTSDPAMKSYVLRLDVSQSGAVVIVVTPELTQSIEPTAQPTAVVVENTYISKEGYPRFSAWLVAMLFIALSIWVAYGMGIRIANRRSAFRWALGIVLGGLLAYNYLVFGMFGVMNWLTASGLSGVIIFVFMGELIGFAAGWAWSRRS
jgi:beta-N-acetylhexosaminidase